MFEFTAALAIICAIIIGVKYGFHEEGGAGVIAFLLMFGIAFVVIGAIILLFAFVVG
jgi:hypothetical protein